MRNGDVIEVLPWTEEEDALARVLVAALWPAEYSIETLRLLLQREGSSDAIGAYAEVDRPGSSVTEV